MNQQPVPIMKIITTKSRSVFISTLCFVALIAHLTAPFALAANRWWDGTNTLDPGDGIGQGGTANWGSTNKVWDAGVGLDHTNWVNGANDTAIFEGTPGTVNITHQKRELQHRCDQDLYRRRGGRNGHHQREHYQ
jgi:hypothetical protein